MINGEVGVAGSSDIRFVYFRLFILIASVLAITNCKKRTEASDLEEISDPAAGSERLPESIDKNGDADVKDLKNHIRAFPSTKIFDARSMALTRVGVNQTSVEENYHIPCLVAQASHELRYFEYEICQHSDQDQCTGDRVIKSGRFLNIARDKDPAPTMHCMAALNQGHLFVQVRACGYSQEGGQSQDNCTPWKGTRFFQQSTNNPDAHEQYVTHFALAEDIYNTGLTIHERLQEYANSGSLSLTDSGTTGDDDPQKLSDIIATQLQAGPDVVGYYFLNETEKNLEKIASDGWNEGKSQSLALTGKSSSAREKFEYRCRHLEFKKSFDVYYWSMASDIFMRSGVSRETARHVVNSYYGPSRARTYIVRNDPRVSEKIDKIIAVFEPKSFRNQLVASVLYRYSSATKGQISEILGLLDQKNHSTLRQKLKETSVSDSGSGTIIKLAQVDLNHIKSHCESDKNISSTANKGHTILTVGVIGTLVAGAGLALTVFIDNIRWASKVGGVTGGALAAGAQIFTDFGDDAIFFMRIFSDEGWHEIPKSIRTSYAVLGVGFLGFLTASIVGGLMYNYGLAESGNPDQMASLMEDLDEMYTDLKLKKERFRESQQSLKDL